MSIYHKVRSVNALFNRLEKDVSRFRNDTKIGCFSGCGLCCHKPDIEASVLEFLPFSYYLIKSGRIPEYYEKLQASGDSSICVIHKMIDKNAGKGYCGEYLHRGLICRLFGYSAMINKIGQKTLVTCKRIKTETPEAYQDAVAKIESGMNVPVMSTYYRQLMNIDFELASRRYPINKAIEEAIKVTMSYYAYRRLKITA